MMRWAMYGQRSRCTRVRSSYHIPGARNGLTFPSTGRKIKVYPSVGKLPVKEVMKLLAEKETAKLDPTGWRGRLFSRTNAEGAHVGDILQVRRKNGEPFAGVCINVRRRGASTAFLLRNHLTRIGVEMWFKIYNPNIEGVDIVQKRPKRARRAKLYYLRSVYPQEPRENDTDILQQAQARFGKRTESGRPIYAHPHQAPLHLDRRQDPRLQLQGQVCQQKEVEGWPASHVFLVAFLIEYLGFQALISKIQLLCRNYSYCV